MPSPRLPVQFPAGGPALPPSPKRAVKSMITGSSSVGNKLPRQHSDDSARSGGKRKNVRRQQSDLSDDFCPGPESKPYTPELLDSPQESDSELSLSSDEEDLEYTSDNISETDGEKELEAKLSEAQSIIRVLEEQINNMQSRKATVSRASNTSLVAVADASVDTADLKKGGRNVASSEMPIPEGNGPVKLANSWTFFWMPPNVEGDYKDSLKTLSSCSTVQEYWRVMNNLPGMSEMPSCGSLSMMKSGVRPIWEDANNWEGGIWSVQIANEDLDYVWEEVTMALIGEQFVDRRITKEGDAVHGISLVSKADSWMLQIWNKNGLTPSFRVLELIEQCVPRATLREPFYKKNKVKATSGLHVPGAASCNSSWSSRLSSSQQSTASGTVSTCSVGKPPLPQTVGQQMPMMMPMPIMMPAPQASGSHTQPQFVMLAPHGQPMAWPPQK